MASRATRKKNTKPKKGSKKTAKRTSSKVVAVDFGAHTLKLAEVEHGPLGPIIKTFGVSPYRRTRNDQVDLVKTFEELKHDAGTATRDVLLVLPETDVFVLQGQNANNEITQRCVVWPVEGTDQSICVPHVALDFYRNVLETAGSRLAGVQHVPTALGRTFAGTRRGAALDIGAESSSWYVYDHGRVVQRSTIPYGSEALTKALALAHGWEMEVAEDHKRSLTGAPSTWPTTTAAVVSAYTNRWWNDLLSNLAHAPAHLERVVLTGGGSQSIPLREFIFDQLGVIPEDWLLPPHAHVAESLRPHLEPHVPVLANSLSLLVYS